MARIFLVLAAIISSGCGMFDFEPVPKDIYAESRFTPEELPFLVNGIAAANEQLGALTDRPVLDYKGTFIDPNGFDINDFGDGFHVIYKLEKSTPEYQWLYEVRGDKHAAGYGTLADMIMFVEEGEGWKGRHGLVLHELGHFLGLQHSSDPEAVMHTPNKSNAYTPTDIAAFCTIYRCK